MDIVLSGAAVLAAGLPDEARLQREVFGSGPVTRITMRAGEAFTWDTGLLTQLARLQRLADGAGATLQLDHLPEGVRRLHALANAVPERQGARRDARREPMLSRFGNTVLRAGTGVHNAVTFMGEAVLSIMRMVSGRARFRMQDLFLIIEDCGARAFPIVSLISLLVGMILAFVGAIQLQLFGAQIFVAGLVAVGMAMEMGGLMTGIIMAGRSGASFAAQIGTMQVNEEIDALETLGVPPMDFLVLPRMTALILMMPLLCLYAIFMGILGGLIVGVLVLDIPAQVYISETIKALSLRFFAQGLIKSTVYGILIAMAGCYQGIRCGRSASAVGEATTAAVVNSIVAIVVADALITLLFIYTGFP